jgi:hypothetical protein
MRTADEPRLGTPTALPEGSEYSLDGIRSAFTIRFDEFVAAVGKDRAEQPARSFATTIPITGDTGPAAIEVAVDGDVFTDGYTTAKLTVAVNDRPVIRVFPIDANQEFVYPVAVRLRGAPECRILVRLEVSPDPSADGPVARLSTTAINGVFL